MALYILKSTIIIGILLAVYHLFLEKEKMHQFNRFYLLSGLVLAFVTPLITVGSIDPVTTSSIITSAPLIINEMQTGIIHETSKGLDWLLLILGTYSLITLIMLLRFINNIGILLLKTRQTSKVIKDGYKLVLIDDITLPHTFMKYVFMNRVDYESGNIEPELFIHESTHAKQLHSIDIIIIEFIQIFCWFNPLILLYKKAIQLNHEFLADEAVVTTIDEVPAYQHLLLDKASHTDQVYLASNLNFSVTKKRLQMMTKPISKRRNVVYGLMIIPLGLMLVSCFGEYDSLRPQADSYIDYINKDKFSVNFTGMTQEQLSDAQWEITKEGIDISFDSLVFNPNGSLNNLITYADFNNGTTMKSSISCGDFSEPFGLWVNRLTNDFGIGFLSVSYDKNKENLWEKMKSANKKGAKYYIGEVEVSFEEAEEWLAKTDRWQSHIICEDRVSQVYTIKLDSSIDYNPIKKLKSYFSQSDTSPSALYKEEKPIKEQYIGLNSPNPTASFDHINQTITSIPAPLGDRPIVNVDTVPHKHHHTENNITDVNKQNFIKQMGGGIIEGSKYFIAEKEVTYNQLVKWLNKAEYYQSSVKTIDPVNGTYLYRLSSPLGDAYNSID